MADINVILRINYGYIILQAIELIEHFTEKIAKSFIYY